jgi:hypothetical protein
MNKHVIIVIGLLLANSVSWANCIYQGVSYPSGAVIGPYVCQGNSWVRR